ncbi:SAM-dependent methyltransferase [Pseudomonas syringae pv. actinidiae]|uniref:SAM-dependent methyltransferase n=1 Tax=Pseudomonas syringae pv. actinidiae TaxID=103796 RepID=A0A2V0QCQ0_PSESF|nr:SAM-dependent methyltransferase [Pseudomonas syringae pv. actinidiae]
MLRVYERTRRRPLVRDLSRVGADLSAICREPAAKPVHAVYLVKPK